MSYRPTVCPTCGKPARIRDGRRGEPDTVELHTAKDGTGRLCPGTGAEVRS